MRILLTLLLTTLLIGCKTYSDEEVKEFDKQIEKYLKEQNIDCTKSSSGLHYKIIEEGEGPLIKFTNVVSFKYKGSLIDGTVFDDHSEEAVEFKVNELIGAWKEIMLELREGGSAFLVAPPQLGYGTHKLEKIPESSILVFELEVVEVK